MRARAPQWWSTAAALVGLAGTVGDAVRSAALGLVDRLCAWRQRSAGISGEPAMAAPGKGETAMPEKRTLERARRDREAGKAATTQAGEFVREEVEHLKAGKHGAKNPRQAVAIGLSKARRAGVDLPPPEKGRVQAKTQRSAQSAYRAGQKSGPLKKGAAPAKERTAAKARTTTAPKASAAKKAPRRKR